MLNSISFTVHSLNASFRNKQIWRRFFFLLSLASFSHSFNRECILEKFRRISKKREQKQQQQRKMTHIWIFIFPCFFLFYFHCFSYFSACNVLMLICILVQLRTFVTHSFNHCIYSRNMYVWALRRSTCPIWFWGGINE